MMRKNNVAHSGINEFSRRDNSMPTILEKLELETLDACIVPPVCTGSVVPLTYICQASSPPVSNVAEAIRINAYASSLSKKAGSDRCHHRQTASYPKNTSNHHADQPKNAYNTSDSHAEASPPTLLTSSILDELDSDDQLGSNGECVKKIIKKYAISNTAKVVKMTFLMRYRWCEVNMRQQHSKLNEAHNRAKGQKPKQSNMLW